MALLPERDTNSVWRLPVGAANPLWAAYAGMAASGVAFWWMSRWAEQWTKPINLEAFVLTPAKAAGDSTVPAMMAQTLAALQPEPIAPPMDPAVDPDDPAAQLAEAGLEAMEAAAEAVGEAAMAASLAADDLTRLVGIGPTLATKLADLGVRTYADIAAWSEEDVDKMDKALDLKGRAVREAWVDQARQFAEQ